LNKSKIIVLYLLIVVLPPSYGQNLNKKVDEIIEKALRINLKNYYYNKVNCSNNQCFIVDDFFSDNIKNDIFNNEWNYSELVYKEIDYQVDNYTLYEIIISPYIEFGNKQLALSYPESYLVGNSKKILLGIYKKDIIFMSGDLYHSKYSKLILKKDNSIKKYIEFLNLKLHSYNINNISYVKKKKKWLYFSAYEMIFTKKTKVYFRVNKETPDLVEYLGWKISGRYKNREKIKIY